MSEFTPLTPTEEIDEWVYKYGGTRDALNVALAKLAALRAELDRVKKVNWPDYVIQLEQQLAASDERHSVEEWRHITAENERLTKAVEGWKAFSEHIMTCGKCFVDSFDMCKDAMEMLAWLTSHPQGEEQK
jgi:hypothetical protein